MPPSRSAARRCVPRWPVGPAPPPRRRPLFGPPASTRRRAVRRSTWSPTPAWPSTSRRRSRLRPSSEQAGDPPVIEELLDRLPEQGGDREDGELVELLLGTDRQLVGDDDLAVPAVLEPVDGR